MDYITSARFKAGQKGNIAKQVSAAPLIDGESRVIRFVVSTGSPDRDNDVVVQAGIDTSAYEKCNVLLWGHDSSELPIGKCIAIGLNADGNLEAAFQMVPADMPVVGDRAEAVFRMCKEGFLFATSIGFVPTEWERSTERDSGYNFLKTQLLEISVVSVPAQPEALIINEPEETPEPMQLLSADADKARRKRLYWYIAAKR
jgi:HK97 family phage prohead protease